MPQRKPAAARRSRRAPARPASSAEAPAPSPTPPTPPTPPVAATAPFPTSAAPDATTPDGLAARAAAAWSWRRRAGESAAAYAAFVAFREAPPAVRAVSRVAAALALDAASCRAWFKEFEWAARARTWDLEQHQLAALAGDDAQRAARAMRERHLLEARQVQRLALERLRALDPQSLRPETLVRWLKTGCELEATAWAALARDAAAGETAHDRHWQERVLLEPRAAEHLIALGELLAAAPDDRRADDRAIDDRADDDHGAGHAAAGQDDELSDD